MNNPTSHPDSSSGLTAAPRLPLVNLSFDSAGQLCFVPRDQAGFSTTNAEPQPLPSLPLSLTFWLMTLGDIHRQKSGRCLAALLLFDTSAKSWGIGLPRQWCSPDSVCWSLALDAEHQIPPSVIAAGSWQMRAQADPDELESVVPSMPGIHFVAQVLDEGQRHLHAFLRTGDVTRTINPADVTTDDWQFALNEAAGRLVAA